MKVVGLITEYNPFHNGHKYHIEEAKRVTGADYAVAVMSGNFVQRGTPALIDKYSRAEMALRNGVDLVLELPVCYATGSAEYFAHGAVSLLDKLGIVDTLCFGSEYGDIQLLSAAAQFLSDTPDAFDRHLQTFLKDGLTYPAARLKALEHSIEAINHKDGQALSMILTEPNNILGIEYMKALKTFSSSILPVTIQRKSAHYHSQELTDHQAPAMPSSLQTKALVPSDSEKDNLYQKGDAMNRFSLPSKDAPNDLEINDEIISSATAIRKAIYSKEKDEENDNFMKIRSSVPEDVYKYLTNKHFKTYPITEEDFSAIIKYKLLSEEKDSLSEILDISSDLADRLKNITDLNRTFGDLVKTIKTKNMTLTRINRAIIHLLLNIKTRSVQEYRDNGYTFYARILGLKKESSQLLRRIEANERIPIITKVSEANTQLDKLGARMLSEDLFAAHIYNQAVYEKYGTTILNEYKHGIVII